MKKIALIQFRSDPVVLEQEIKHVLSKINVERESLEIFNALSYTLPAIDVDQYSAFIFAGSGEVTLSDRCHKGKFVKANVSWLIKEVVQKDKLSLFICLGLHLLSEELGVSVQRCKVAAEVGTVPVSLTQNGKNDPLFQSIDHFTPAQAAHNDSIFELPSGAVLLGTNEKCPVQAFRLKRNIYATQFHPEMNKDDFFARLSFYPHYVEEHGLTLKESPQVALLMKNFIDMAFSRFEREGVAEQLFEAEAVSSS